MTDVSALEGYAGQFSEAAAMAVEAAHQNKKYIHGSAVEDVQTESGPVPTLAKQARLNREAMPDAVEELRKELGSIVEATHQKLSIYLYERVVSTGDKLMRISPQLNLRSQHPAIDWVGIADTTGPCTLEFRIINDGVSMSVPVTVQFVAGEAGVATFTVTPHNLYNGDVLEITCTAGSATSLALTARYDIGEAP